MGDEVLQLLQKAARIKLAIFSAPNFTIPIALYCAGLEIKDARKKLYIDQTDIIIKSMGREEIHHIPININNPDAGNQNLIERACILKSITKRMPKAKKHMHQEMNLKKIKVDSALTTICRWAGFPENYLSGSSRKVYKQVNLFAGALEKKTVEPMLATSKERSPRKYF